MEDSLPAEAVVSFDARDAPHADIIPTEERLYTIQFKFQAALYTLEINSNDLVLDLKTAIYSLTNVPNERQKLLGLTKGKLPSDDTPLSSLNLDKVVKPFSVIGTPDGEEIKRIGADSDITKHWDLDVQDLARHDPAYLHAREQRKVQEATSQLSLDLMHPPRTGRKLLVLDLDYTLLDCKRWSEPGVSMLDFERPGLHTFLKTVYPFYDLAIWSQTHWRFLESKLIELGMIGGQHNDYLISFCLDKSCMFEVVSEKSGKMVKHSVKALQIIWNKLPHAYSAKNTLHVDDLSRNFKLNPANGIKVHAFHDAAKNQHDHELEYLSKFLLSIKDVEDVATLDIHSWRSWAKKM